MLVIQRDSHNPLLSPKRDRPWEAVATFNPSAVVTDEGTRVYYRALGNPDVLQTPHAGLSTIGTAFAEDGVHFHSRRQVLVPQESWDAFGCEDPRVTHFEGKWYCFYTALGGYPFGPDNIKVAVAIGDSPTDFTRRYLVTPFNAKAATLFPERIDGNIVLLLTAHTDWTEAYPRPTIALAKAKKMEDFFDPEYWRRWHDHLSEHALGAISPTERNHVEVGASPLLTKHGWLLIYSYIKDYYDGNNRVFSIAAALLDHKDPRTCLSQTDSLMVPQEMYEEYGLVPHIVFPTSITRRGDLLDIWYGAADTVCAKASVKLDSLLTTLNHKKNEVFKRSRKNPILSPRGNGFESRDVFNPAAIELDGSIYILYRAMDEANTSTVGLAITKDGEKITERLTEPVYVPRADFEAKRGSPTGNSGCEDPRIVKIGTTLYMTYTAYDGVRSPMGAITSMSAKDFVARKFDKWSEPQLITPDGVDDKDLCLLPAKVGDNYLLYHRIHGQICADLLPDLKSGKRVSRCIEVLAPRRGMWDGAKVGSAAPPFKVKEGWLMIYHAVGHDGVYRLGAALLDHDGVTVLTRTADPIFEPVELYEKEGEIPNVVFSCGAVLRDDTILLYYGGADRVIAVATASLRQIVNALT